MNILPINISRPENSIIHISYIVALGRLIFRAKGTRILVMVLCIYAAEVAVRTELGNLLKGIRHFRELCQHKEAHMEFMYLNMNPLLSNCPVTLKSIQVDVLY